MARELSLAFTMALDDDESYMPFVFFKKLIDVAGNNFLHNKQDIGATEEALVRGDVTQGGYFAARNNHATGVISLRNTTGACNCISLKPGDGCVFRVSADVASLYAISSVAGAELEYLIVDL